MKVRLVSVFRISGIAKASGDSFGPLYRLGLLKPLELVDSAKFKKHGNGFEVVGAEISEEVFKKFCTLQIPLGGLDLDVTTEQEMGRNGVDTIITGFVVPTIAKAA